MTKFSDKCRVKNLTRKYVSILFIDNINIMNYLFSEKYIILFLSLGQWIVLGSRPAYNHGGIMGKLQNWLIARRELEQWKETEVELRREICASLLGGDLSERTIKEVYDGHVVKVSQKSTRSIDQAALSALWPELEEEAKNCIDFKPSLKLAAYRKLSQDSLLHEAITEKPSPTPTLEVLDAD